MMENYGPDGLIERWTGDGYQRFEDGQVVETRPLDEHEAVLVAGMAARAEREALRGEVRRRARAYAERVTYWQGQIAGGQASVPPAGSDPVAMAAWCRTVLDSTLDLLAEQMVLNADLIALTLSEYTEPDD